MEIENGQPTIFDGSEEPRRSDVLRQEKSLFVLVKFIFFVFLMVVIFAPVFLEDALQLRIANMCLLGVPLALALFDVSLPSHFFYTYVR